MRSFVLLVMGVSLATALGCGNGGDANDAGADSGKGAVAKGSPDATVRQFLEAVKGGDHEATAALLTETARRETAKHNLDVAPTASPSATYALGETEYVTEEKDGAHVLSKWTDIDADGNPHTDEILWVLRKETEGWRIAGMATRIFEDELPLILNFEEPEEMLRKQQLAEAEMQRRAEQPALQAKRPMETVEQR